jgi:hypothetical protein
VFHTYAFYWVAAGLCFYAVATRGLFRATNNLRMSLIDLAAELIKSPDFPAEQKEMVKFTLDEVHSARAAWRLTFMLLLSLVIFPFVRVPDPMSNIPRKLQPTFDAFITRWVIATVSNSLPATIIFVVVFVIFAAFVSSIKPIGRLLIGRRNKMSGHTGHAAHA